MAGAPINPLWCVSGFRSVLVAGEKAVPYGLVGTFPGKPVVSGGAPIVVFVRDAAVAEQ
jgi:hypothetical protein